MPVNTASLKTFAPAMRRQLLEAVGRKLDLLLHSQTPDTLSTYAKQIAKLREQEAENREQLLERVAYIWFNRLCALRYLDAHGWHPFGCKVLMPAGEAETQPELLKLMRAGSLPAELKPLTNEARLYGLLDGQIPPAIAGADPQGEVYRELVLVSCRSYHQLLPELFEGLDDSSELLLPDDLLSEGSIAGSFRSAISDADCEDVEIIGWLYQFYISEKKDQVFAGLKKKQKITAENIPAATQLFTPHWIVRYLVENSLGRLWLLNRPGSKLAERMDYYIAPEEPETDFLKIGRPEEIKVCDPACGSGHMLTYAFDLLHAIYEEEGYEPDRIPALILQNNLTGVEIDDRAGALAAFALAMKAATRLGRRRFLRMQVKPDIVVLQNITFSPAEMQEVAAVVGRDLFSGALRETLGQFEQAKNLGSLIVPKLRDPAATLRVVASWDFGGDLLLKEVQERVVAVLRMAEALSPKYHVVVANPPYMGGKGMNGKLLEFAKEAYPESRFDLFSAFIERGYTLGSKFSYVTMVTMESWMFLSSFEAMRYKMLSDSTMNTMLHMPYLGKGGTSMGISFGTVAFVARKFREPKFKGAFFCLRYFEADKDGVPLDFPPINERASCASANDFGVIPGIPFAYWVNEATTKAFKRKLVRDYGDTRRGLQTGDKERFVRLWHEASASHINFDAETREEYLASNKKWSRLNSGGPFRKWYGNFDSIINWKNDGREIKSFPSSIVASEHLYFQEAICWGKVTSISDTFRICTDCFLFTRQAE
jgi:hypothetical protein